MKESEIGKSGEQQSSTDQGRVKIPSRFLPTPWEPNLPFDWATGGRQLSEEELIVARRLKK